MTQNCSRCGAILKDGATVFDMVKGEFEGNGMAAHGSQARFCEKCGNFILSRYVG